MGKSYIGQTVDFDGRMYSHKNGYQVDAMYIDRAIQYYGEDNFVYESICDCRNLTHANSMEKFFIAFYDTFKGYGYNLTEGGEGAPLSDETKQKISRFMQGKRQTETTRTYLGVAIHRRGNSYTASVPISIGKTKAKTFQTEIEAAEAYDKAILYIFGENATLNFPENREKYLTLDLKGFYEFFLSPAPKSGWSNYSGATMNKGAWTIHFVREKGDQIAKKIKEMGAMCLKMGKFASEEDAARAADKIIAYFGVKASYNFPDDAEFFTQGELEQFFKTRIKFQKPLKISRKPIVYPERDVLFKLVWERSMRDIGRQIGATDTAVRNYALKQNIPIPSIVSGYWNLMHNLDKPGNFEKCEAIRATNPLPPLH